MSLFKEVTNITREMEDTNIPSPSAVGSGVNKFCEYWPFIKMALKLAKIFTGTKGDQKIDQVIEWGNSTCSN
jgi:hypothetical protein